ncbi:MAG TPA: exosortase B [Burkholderiales bacterium]|jgi:exosortase B
MSAVLSTAPAERRLPALAAWVPVALGLLAMYVPTFVSLAYGIWNDEAYEHGPIVLAVVAWLVWDRRKALAALPLQSARAAGIAALAAGLLLYVVGRSQSLPLFEVASEVPVCAGVLLLFYGWAGVRAMWFPLFFLCFMIPLPGFVLYAITGALKQQVSALAEIVLHYANYPIARSGVIIQIGQYQLLVADACSGLNSMYSLSAMGLLYLYLVRHAGLWRNVLLLAAVVPVAFFANVLRVIILILITYHFGDEAGQGFIHGAAGIVLFVLALLMLFGIDAALSLFARRGRKS